MKYYTKDGQIFIKYISTLTGRPKTLTFNLETDKEFLKKLFSEKREDAKIFMLDDTIREKEHPTDQDIEYTTMYSITKGKDDDKNQKEYQFIQVKLNDEIKKLNEYKERLRNDTTLTPEKRNEIMKEIENCNERIKSYERDLEKLIKTSSDIVKQTKSKEMDFIDSKFKENAKVYINEAWRTLENFFTLKGVSKKEIQEAKEKYKNNFIACLADYSDKIEEKEKNELMKELNLISVFFEPKNIEFKKLEIFKIEKPTNIDAMLSKSFYDNLINIENYFKPIINKINKDDYIIYSTKAFNDKIFKSSTSYFVNRDLKYIYINKYYILLLTKLGFNKYFPDDLGNVGYIRTIPKDFLDSTDKTGKEEVKFVRIESSELRDLKEGYVLIENLLSYISKFKTGKGLKDKIKSSITSDVNQKLNEIIKDMNILKNDYINFKEDIKEQMKNIKDDKKEIKKEIKEVVKEDIKEKPEDFLDLIKNFSKNKLKHTEQQKYVPEEKPSKLEETFEKRRKAFDSEDEEEDNEEDDWLD